MSKLVFTKSSIGHCIIFLSKSKDGVANRRETKEKPISISHAVTLLPGRRLITLGCDPMSSLERVITVDKSGTYLNLWAGQMC